jgi:signal transduction histidine kinase
MREVVIAAIGVSITVVLAWLPLPGIWRPVAGRAYYFPIVAIGARYGPIAGFFAGITAMFLYASIAASGGEGNMTWHSLLTVDFPILGLFGGRFSRWGRLRELDALSRTGARPEAGTLAEVNMDAHLNPLASIEGAAGLLADDEIPAGVRQELVRIISAECRQLSGRMVNLLQHGRSESSARVPDADIAQIIESALLQAQFILSVSNSTLRREIAREIPAISCNPDQIRSLLITLTVILLRFMPAGHHVVVRAGRQGDDILLNVSTEGENSWRSKFSRVFHKVFGAPMEGLSLDLAAAYDIVHRHGGKIEGGLSRTGGSFSVWLPLRLNDEDVKRNRFSGGR